MAVVKMVEVSGGRTGGEQVAENGVSHNYTRVVKVETDSDTDGVVAIRQAIGISLGSAYSNGTEADSFAHCQSIDYTCDEPRQWTVTLQYGPIDPLYSNINPVDNQPRVSWDSVDVEEVVDTDESTGDPIVNTVGDEFQPGPTRLKPLAVLRVSRAQSTFDATTIYTYKGTVNSVAFAGADVHTLLLKNISAEKAYSSMGSYWEVVYEFVHDPDTWHYKPINRGYRLIDTTDPSGNKRKNILISGVPPTEPVPISEDGTQTIPPPLTADNMVVLDFDIYREQDFHALGLPASIFT